MSPILLHSVLQGASTKAADPLLLRNLRRDVDDRHVLYFGIAHMCIGVDGLSRLHKLLQSGWHPTRKATQNSQTA